MSTYYGYLRKAWDIIGYTQDGETYCIECQEYGNNLFSATPLFVSDEWSPMPCYLCGDEVSA